MSPTPNQNAIKNAPRFSPTNGHQSAAESGKSAAHGALLATKIHPTLPTDALFGLAGDVAREVARISEADPAAVLITFLTYAGALFGSGVFVGVGDTKHPPRLFAAIVGASSRARKGTSFNPVHRIVERAAELKTSCVVQMSHGPCSSGEGLIYTVRDASEKLNEDTKEPIDPGIEDKRLFIIESELGAALKALQREGNTLSATLRTAWDHGNISPLTKSNKIKATGAHICIAGHITSMELRELLRGSDISNGLANRFLWINVRRQRVIPIPQAVSANTIDRFGDRLAAAVETAHMLGRIELDEEAVVMWEELYPKLTEDQPGIFGYVTSRSEAQVVRIALIYALLDCSASVRTPHVHAAYALWRYAMESARFIFGDLQIDRKSSKILMALAEGEKTQTQLNNLFDGHFSAEALQQTLADLQASGRITQNRRGGGGKGQGRPTTVWNITPGFERPVAELEELEE